MPLRQDTGLPEPIPSSTPSTMLDARLTAPPRTPAPRLISVTPEFSPRLRTLTLALDTLGADYAGVMWLDDHDTIHRQVAGIQKAGPTLENALFTHSRSGERGCVVMDARSDEHLCNSRLVRDYCMDFFATCPIRTGDDKKIGDLYVCGTRTNHTREECTQLIGHMASYLAMELRGLILEHDNRELSRKLAEAERRARVDALTAIWNHAGIIDLLRHRLEQAEREQANLTLLFIDIDRFKQVNDSLGHQAGNDVLREVCRRIENALRPYDEVGRYGGDELVAIVNGQTEPMLRELAERVRAAVATTPIPTCEGDIDTTISIGLASAHTGAASTLENLLLRADAALYRAKRLGRNRIYLAK